MRSRIGSPATWAGSSTGSAEPRDEKGGGAIPASQRTARAAAGRPPTLTEQARRAQLIAVTIELIARHGYAHCSLQRIADAAGITKAAVIYHFASKNAVIKAAYDSVISALVEHVGARVEAAATPAAAVDAYLGSLAGYMARHPSHVRLIVEALAGRDTADTSDTSGIEDSPHAAGRWRTLAALMDRAVAAGEYRSGLDTRVLAIMMNGAVDAVVAETLHDPGFDLAAATEALLDLLRRTARTTRAATRRR